MSRRQVWFNRPAVTGRELEYMRKALEAGHISGDGAFTRRCHEHLERITGAARAFLTTSCTHALEMTMLLLEVGPDDEVICPAFTFVSTANAIALRGARPVFVDVRPDTLNVDENQLESLITSKTRAIMLVHYAGVACEMDRITAIASKHHLALVEDNAHGLFGGYKGRALGTFAPLATLSFHETKNVTCGEGGALLVNDRGLIERAEILREKGTNRSRFFRGQIDRYTWVDVGSSYLPSDLLAGYLLAQLESYEAIQRRRHELWSTYHRELGAWAASIGARMPTIPDGCNHPAHIFYLVMPSLAVRTAFIDHLRSREVLAVFHYQALHVSDMGRQFGGRPGQCPVTERMADQLVRLPLFFQMTAEDQLQVLDAVTSFRAA